MTETELISPYDRRIILKERGENPKFFYNFTKPYSNNFCNLCLSVNLIFNNAFFLKESSTKS